MSLVEEVTLVDANGKAIGTAEKMSAHRQGLLHSAVSVFLFDQKGRMLLQRRAFHKYHCGGLWANSCCSHPRPSELPEHTASRRIFEELGVSASLERIGTHLYRANVGNGLVENEYVYLFRGTLENDEMTLNSEEVADVTYLYPDEIRNLRERKDNLAPWFAIYLEQIGDLVCAAP